jgi:hypothetical protein
VHFESHGAACGMIPKRKLGNRWFAPVHLDICQIELKQCGVVTSCHFRDTHSLEPAAKNNASLQKLFSGAWLVAGDAPSRKRPSRQAEQQQSNQGGKATARSRDSARFSRRVIDKGQEVGRREKIACWRLDGLLISRDVRGISSIGAGDG